MASRALPRTRRDPSSSRARRSGCTRPLRRGRLLRADEVQDRLDVLDDLLGRRTTRLATGRVDDAGRVGAALCTLPALNSFTAPAMSARDRAVLRRRHLALRAEHLSELVRRCPSCRATATATSNSVQPSVTFFDELLAADLDRAGRASRPRRLSPFGEADHARRRADAVRQRDRAAHRPGRDFFDVDAEADRDVDGLVELRRLGLLERCSLPRRAVTAVSRRASLLVLRGGASIDGAWCVPLRGACPGALGLRPSRLSLRPLMPAARAVPRRMRIAASSDVAR